MSSHGMIGASDGTADKSSHDDKLSLAPSVRVAKFLFRETGLLLQGALMSCLSMLQISLLFTNVENAIRPCPTIKSLPSLQQVPAHRLEESAKMNAIVLERSFLVADGVSISK